MQPTRLSLCSFASALLALSLTATAQPLPASEPLAAGLIVKFRQNLRTPLAAEAAMQGFRASAEARGMAVAHEREGVLGTRVLRLQRARSARELAQLARELQASDATIEYVEPDWLMQAQATPTDPGWLEQWPLQQWKGGIGAEAAWDISQGAGIRVAVLDTGSLPHEDLKANLLPGYDFLSSVSVSRDGDGRDADASDAGDWTTQDLECGPKSVKSNSSWHGLHVSGIVAAAANNGLGYSGVAPKAKILPVRVLGHCGGPTSDIAAGILWASGHAVAGVPANATPARVLNLSLGSISACAQTTQNAIDAARAKGALVVVAAGNDDIDASLKSPANCKGVLAVGASTIAGGRAAYSNFGETLALSAPGGDSAKPVPGLLNAGATTPTMDAYGGLFGTSMAAPHVSGTAALMMSANSLLPADVAHWLMVKTTKPFALACTNCGSGILDAQAAVLAARGWRPEREPNDNLAQAQFVNVFPARVWGAIEPTASQVLDHYALSLPAGGKLGLRLEMLDLPGFDLQTGMELLDLSGKVLQTGLKAGGLIDVSYQNISSSGVTLYVRVKGKPTFGSGTTKSYRYELKLLRS